MSNTINHLAKLSGITVRTLRFYDEIGLLKPAYIAENGYRYYEEKQLLELQQILFFRELGLELKEIQRIIKQDSFDQLESLKAHKKLLRKNITRMTNLIKTVDTTISHIEKKLPIPEEEIFKYFTKEENLILKKLDEIPGYKEYVTKASKNSAPATQESIEHMRNFFGSLSREDWNTIHKTTQAIFEKLSKFYEKNAPKDSQEVQDTIKDYYDFTNKMNPISEEMTQSQFIQASENVKEPYLANASFKNSPNPELVANYMSEAMKIFALNNLS